MNISQIIKYCIGGTGAFFFDLLLIYVFVNLGVHKNLALVLGFLISALTFSFLFHKNITFAAAKKYNVFHKYILASIFMFIIDMGGGFWLTDVLIARFTGVYDYDMLVLAGKTISAAFAGATNFITLKFWVFKEK